MGPRNLMVSFISRYILFVWAKHVFLCKQTMYSIQGILDKIVDGI